VAHSSNGGTNWDGLHTFDTNYLAGGAELIQVPDGTIYGFWLKGTAASSPTTNAVRYAWLSGGSGDEHFCADDYTWAASDNSYFYFAWCDRSRTHGTPPHIRPDADVKFAKTKQ